jgi:hypothetical protein
MADNIAGFVTLIYEMKEKGNFTDITIKGGEIKTKSSAGENVTHTYKVDGNTLTIINKIYPNLTWFKGVKQ